MGKPNLEENGIEEQNKVEYYHDLYLRMKKEFVIFQKQITRTKKIWRNEERKQAEDKKAQLEKENEFLMCRVRMADSSTQSYRPQKRARTLGPSFDLLRKTDQARDLEGFGKDTLLPRNREAFDRVTLSRHAKTARSSALEDVGPNLRLDASSGDGFNKTHVPTPESSSTTRAGSWRRSGKNHNSCTCVDLPPYFSRYHGILPSLATWPWGKIEFLAHAEQVANCKGHDRQLIAACSKICKDNSTPSDTEAALNFAEGFLASGQPSKNKCKDHGRFQSSIPAYEFYGSEISVQNSQPTAIPSSSPRTKTRFNKSKKRKRKFSMPDNAIEEAIPDPSKPPINPNPPTLTTSPSTPTPPLPPITTTNPPPPLRKKNKSVAEKKIKHPELSANVPPHLLNSDEDIIRIGRIVNPHERHTAAPEAFSWAGRLRAKYNRFIDTLGDDGQPVWMAKELRRLC